MIPQNLFMLALFGDFYYRAYVQEKPKRDREPVAAFTSIEKHANDKVHTNGDTHRYRHVNGSTSGYTNGHTAKNGFMNGNSNGHLNGNGDKISNGNVMRKLNEMS